MINRKVLFLLMCVTMVVDHVGLVFFPGVIWWRLVGRVGFVLFVVGVGMGLRYTRDVLDYAGRLFVLGVMSQGLVWSLNGVVSLCCVWGFFLSALIWRSWCERDWLGLGVLLFVSGFIPVDYGMAWILGPVIIAGSGRWVGVAAACVSLLAAVCLGSVMQVFGVLGAVLVWRGVKESAGFPRWLVYGFYPVHIGVIICCRDMLCR
ncbi:MAG: TraX family protein [Phycisphaerae bacterium]|jgi:hypothetical protein|nr:TraX family protein [Phycisphaerae bacterium]